MPVKMIYCVVPKALEDELYPKLLAHYEQDENVTVIVERREADRRGRRAGPVTPEDRQRRIVRDRRRARVAGDLLPLAQP
jgi:hypothetical protein